MDNVVYTAITRYYTALSKLGYYKYKDVLALLVLSFYWDFVFNDYRGILTKDDYTILEEALNCLFGSSCLIPYIDYVKMGKLHIGEMTELASRLNNIENTKILKLGETESATSDSDIEITEVNI